MSAGFLSAVKRVNELFIHTKRFRPTKGDRIDVIVMRNNRLLIRFKDGHLWTNFLRDGAYTPGRWPWLDDLTEMLVQAGALTKPEIEEWKVECQAARDASDLKFDKKEFARLRAKYGDRLTKLRKAEP
jgi:hypothetical protein